MDTKQYTRYGWMLLCLPLLVIGCSSPSEQTKLTDEEVIDSPPEADEVNTLDIGVAPLSDMKPMKYSIFTLENIAFYRKSLHYENPAQFTIHNDGSWDFYASRIANFRRTGLGGQTWHLTLRAKYYGEIGCTGPIVHARNYHLFSIKYHGDERNIARSGRDEKFAEQSSQIRCVSYSQSWH
ncbi:hypothetical protein M0C34_01005 [Agarivorans sp. TSD2052]|uniref:hypothetical protein n=1 Tax=Agarivorans sp. TSD2052 TaxID=2937286 RepID=UPI00200CE204|nr:hypothetical protein [Agarivorans sp. TSD2052]UPW18886.1 hypothetical protein M0C34_01005 [Agarivorans sp. TSD2052]